MSFCCGASKIGSIASLHRGKVLVHNVPILYCPVCKSVEPHPKIKENLNFIVEVAKEDHLDELYLDYYLDAIKYDDLFETCATVNKGNNNDEIMQSQIDISLDLLSAARLIEDKEWEESLKNRLSLLSKQKGMLKNK